MYFVVLVCCVVVCFVLSVVLGEHPSISLCLILACIVIALAGARQQTNVQVYSGVPA